MAIYDLKSMQIDTGSADIQEELKKLNSYLYKNNETLNYVLSNLNPEDNFSNKAYEAYESSKDAISSLEVSTQKIELSYEKLNEAVADIKLDVDGIKISYVRNDGIISAINLSSEGIAIQGSKINLTGAISANNNVTISTDGKLTANEATIKGSITAGSTIAGTTISGSTVNAATITGSTINGAAINGGSISGEVEINCGADFSVINADDNENYQINVGHFGAFYSGGTHNFGSNQSYIDENGKIYGNDLTFDDSWTKGWGLLEMLKDLYDRVESLEDAIE